MLNLNTACCMEKPRRVIAFRADGSARRGLGHVYRSAALADMLRPVGELVYFYHELPEALLPHLRETYVHCHHLASANSEGQIEELAGHLKLHYPDREVIVVLDGYHFDTGYQRRVKDRGYQLVCIDDIHACHYVADLVINHAPSAKVSDYSGEAATKFAFGLRFALLREPFLMAARARSTSAPKLTPGHSERVFMCLGGADPNNDTLDILRLVEEREPNCEIDLVLGAAYLHDEQLTDFLRGANLNVSRHRGLAASEMVELMGRSTCAITSPSTICLEYLSAGHRLYLRQIADNQAEIYAALLKRGWAADVDSFGTNEEAAISTHAVNPIDGLQAKRFQKLFTALSLRFRPADLVDSDLYLKWVNDEAVRLQSFDSKPVVRADHEAWYGARMADPDSFLFVVEMDEEPVGQVRFAVEGELAYISYSVASSARGRGLGFAMLHFAAGALKRERPEVSRLAGYVKNDNPASLVTFRNLGYVEQATTDYPNAVKFILDEL